MAMGSSEDLGKVETEIKRSDGDDAKTIPPDGIVDKKDLFEIIWGWDRLLPFTFNRSGEWWPSDYRDYLRQYYERNASSVITEATGNRNSLVAAAEICFKKEQELVSLWKDRVVTSPGEILADNTIVQSNMIQKLAHSVMCDAEGKLSVTSTVAFACIAKEAELICELLKRDAKHTDDIIQQSDLIRFCALSLAHLQGSQAIDAAAAMVGITKECSFMCDWMKKKDKPITFSVFSSHRQECLLIRITAYEVMFNIMNESSFPSCKENKLKMLAMGGDTRCIRPRDDPTSATKTVVEAQVPTGVETSKSSAGNAIGEPAEVSLSTETRTKSGPVHTEPQLAKDGSNPTLSDRLGSLISKSDELCRGRCNEQIEDHRLQALIDELKDLAFEPVDALMSIVGKAQKMLSRIEAGETISQEEIVAF